MLEITVNVITNQYYNDISKIVCNYCYRHKLHLLDIFLVGSRVSNNGILHNKDADYDSIIIINNNFTLENLKMFRDNLQDEISRVDKLNLYHFKLFSLSELEKAKLYDGFRIFEFHSGNISFLKKKNDFFSSSLLSEKNFINSLLIQEVHEKLINKIGVDTDKIKTRFERNLKILENQKIIPSYSTDLELFCREKDTLYWQYKQLKNDKSDWVDFMQKYFNRFRHEYINKSKSYFAILQIEFSNILIPF